MDINKKIINLCNERSWSVYELSIQSGITQSSLNSMLHRGNPPKIENLQCICEAFGITLSQFFLDDEQVEILNSKEKELVSSFRRLSEKQQQALLDFINK
ncbi:MAG: helix-turn-helix transcriptional regulator [Clostridia bacterium]|nr:helix-turn-helix transcriptional regulator [Clostridia bacterium]